LKSPHQDQNSCTTSAKEISLNSDYIFPNHLHEINASNAESLIQARGQEKRELIIRALSIGAGADKILREGLLNRRGGQSDVHS
jgi:hypothetical protein